MEKNKTLFLFTGGFPYGNKMEPFLETEIIYLAEKFRYIYIFPRTKDKSQRIIPENVEINDEFSTLNLSKFTKLTCLFKNIILVFKMICMEIKDKSFIKVVKNRKTIFDYLATQIYISEAFKKRDFNDVIVYDYWFYNFTLALSLIKRKKPNLKFISRGHGFDIYDERNGEYGVPFRAWKIKYIDELSIISKFGQTYTKMKVAPRYRDKVTLNYLGVKKSVVSNFDNQTNEIKLIVSCSNILGFKNVHRIPNILKLCNSKIKWIHFGSGSFEKCVIENAKNLGDNISFELMGQVDNSSVLDFYKKNKVDLFITLSESEGLPVSMMEAIGFGIPILAHPVGGIPEIVINGLTGMLLPISLNDEEIAKEIELQLRFDFNQKEIINFFDNNFNADNNYPKFISETLCV